MAARVALIASCMASPAQRAGWHNVSLSLRPRQTAAELRGSQMLLLSAGRPPRLVAASLGTDPGELLRKHRNSGLLWHNA